MLQFGFKLGVLGDLRRHGLSRAPVAKAFHDGLQVVRSNYSQRVDVSAQEHITNAFVGQSVVFKPKLQKFVGVSTHMSNEGAEQLVLNL